MINNFRTIDMINFPSIKEYDNIEEYTMTSFNIKFKNSNIIIEFKEFENYQTITYKSKIDDLNYENFLINLQYLISKFFIDKITLV